MKRPSTPVVVDVALLVLVAAAAVCILADLQPVRPLVVFLAACFVPGGALVTRLRTGDGVTDLGLAIGLSFALEIAASLVLTWSGWWHPEMIGLVLGVGSIALVASDLVRVSRG